jgi:hypothetical protein
MPVTKRKRALRVLVVVGLAGSPAGALDLTGTWLGKYTCTQYDGTLSKVTVKDDEMRITQTGDVFAVDSQNQFAGVSLPDDKTPDTKGEAKLANCNTDNVVSNGGDELVRLSAKVNREKGKGKLKGSSIYTFPGGVGTCKWSYKLTDPANPNAVGCAGN